MAEIEPLRALCFNAGKVSDLSSVVAPPLDLIDADLQQALYQQSPYNIVRLIVGQAGDQDRSHPNRYGQCREIFNRWCDEDILQRDDQPAIYLYDQHFIREDGRAGVRKGFVALARLEEFASGVVKPHELTEQAVWQERLQLLRQCQAHFSPVFSLYSDPCCMVESLGDDCRALVPDMDVISSDGVRHQVWRMTDCGRINKVKALLDSKPLLLADGHPCYETALAFRDEMRAQHPDYSGKEYFNYVLMYFSNMAQEVSRSAAVHRLLPQMDLESFFARVRAFFTVEAVAEAGSELELKVAQLLEDEQAEAVVYAGSRCYFALTLRAPAAAEALCREALGCVGANLDRTLLCRLVLDQLLQQERHCVMGRFVADRRRAVRAVDDEEAGCALLLPRVKVSAVLDLANAGEALPQHTTCFHPRLLNGLIMNAIVPGGQIGD